MGRVVLAAGELALVYVVIYFLEKAVSRFFLLGTWAAVDCVWHVADHLDWRSRRATSTVMGATPATVGVTAAATMGCPPRCT